MLVWLVFHDANANDGVKQADNSVRVYSSTAPERALQGAEDDEF